MGWMEVESIEQFCYRNPCLIVLTLDIYVFYPTIYLSHFEWRLHPKSCVGIEIPICGLYMAKKLPSTRWGINFKTIINLSIVASWRYGILIRKIEIFNWEGLIFEFFCRAWVGENCGLFDIFKENYPPGSNC